MRNIFILASVFSLFLSTSSCNFVDVGNAMSSTNRTNNGKVIKKNFTIGSFSELEASGLYKIIYAQSTGETSVQISAPEYVMSKLIVKKEGLDKLELSTKNIDLYNNEKIQVWIKAPEIRKIELSGAASINAGTISTNRSMDIELSGASSAEIAQIEAKKLDIDLSGASSLKLNKVEIQEKLKIDNSGASNMSANDIRCLEAEAETSGASNIDIRNLISPVKLKMELSGTSKNAISGAFGNTTVETSGVSSVTLKGKCNSLYVKKDIMSKINKSGLKVLH